ncbi:MAG: Wzz/FepE/Etk N-terminal domain-containing protein, partial [bacterium]
MQTPFMNLPRVPASAPGPLALPPSQAGAQELSIDFWYLWQVARRRRQVIGAFAALVVATTAITVLALRPVYEARALVLIEKVGQNALERESVVMDASQDDYYQTQYQILSSRRRAERVAEDLRLAGNPEFAGADPAGVLQKGHVAIEPVRRTRLVRVVGSSRDPKLAAAIANGLAARYIEQNLENKLFLSKDLLKSLAGKVSQSIKESLPAVVKS